MDSNLEEVKNGNHTTLNLEIYDKIPLPIRSVNQVSEKLTWQDFDLSDDGESIKLYRALVGVNKIIAKETAHLSNFAKSGGKLSNVNTESIYEICSYASQFCQGDSPVIHTSREENFCKNYLGLNTGVVVTYKIPKRHFLTLIKSGHLFSGNQSEKEINFFNELPKKYVSEIQQFGDKIDILIITEETGNVDNIEVIYGDLPLPPEFPFSILM
jgi:hypothetical protein